MKTIRSQAVIDQVELFNELREEQKKIEANLKIIREALMEVLGDEHSAKAGEFLLLVSDRVRTDLDKEALAAEFGDKLKNFQKQSSYQILEIKKA